MKIILLNHDSLSDLIVNVFDFDTLVKKGFDVEYWNMSRLYNFKKNISGLHTRFEIIIKSKKEVNSRIQANNNVSAVYIKMMHFKWADLWLHNILLKNNCVSIFFITHLLPPSIFKKKKKNLLNRIVKVDYKKYLLNNLAKFLWKIRNLDYFTVVFFVGSADSISGGIRASQFIQTNHYDYDQYLISCRNEVNLISHKYIVFLDENRVEHSDNKSIGVSYNKDKYYDRMNIFFDKIENLWGLKVIIAEHPSSNYDNNTFNNRKRYKYQTSNLVKNCEYVFAHWSTSISYAVMNNKPLILLYNNEMRDKDITFFSIINYHEALGSPLYNIDEDNDVELPISNRSKYSYFKNNFLVSQGNENKLSTEIFMDFLLNNSINID